MDDNTTPLITPVITPLIVNNKGKLFEYCQKRGLEEPSITYKSSSNIHTVTMTASCYNGTSKVLLRCECEGNDKKNTEQITSYNLLSKIKKTMIERLKAKINTNAAEYQTIYLISKSQIPKYVCEDIDELCLSDTKFCNQTISGNHTEQTWILGEMYGSGVMNSSLLVFVGGSFSDNIYEILQAKNIPYSTLSINDFNYF